MKINTPIILTATLLTFMVGAGAASGWIGYSMGHEALKGVTQPDVSPTKKLTQTGNSDGTDPQEITIILNEADLIKQAEVVINGNGNSAPPEAQPETDADAEAQVPDDDPQAQLVNHSPDFEPIQSNDQGISLVVANATEADGNYLLDVSLRNDSAANVRFLYSFLDIRDQQGRSLSAMTDGLPGDLPATGEWYSGTVRIPVAMLENTDQISLTLTDYPEQRLQLSLADIPVLR